MNKFILSAIAATFIATAANAGVIHSGGMWVGPSNAQHRVHTHAARSHQPTQVWRTAHIPTRTSCAPAARAAGAQVAVATHQEVITHFQVFQPVVVYQPAGTFSQRQMVKMCGQRVC